jgi:3-phosphoshikimate 1-carboxyvinyltransferase
MKTKMILNSPYKISGEVLLPGSKSITNRALLLSSMSNGKTYLKNILYSDDVKYMFKALKKLGVKFTYFHKKKSCYIYGQGRKFPKIKNVNLYLGNAGTAVRSLLSVLSIKKNSNIILTGDERMHERPIKHLVQALIQGQAKISYLNKTNFLPVLIQGGFIGGKIILNGSISSQFLTALLIASPYSKLNTSILIKGNLVSKPYVDITIKMMQSFGVYVENNQYKEFYISNNQNYVSPKKYHIESDASSASYFLSAAAIKGGTVSVIGVGKNSIQGDIKFGNILKKMGAKIFLKKNKIICTRKKLKRINMDMNDIPDVAMTIAITALFAKGKTTIKNIYNWRVKETDRLSAMANELRKIGAKIKEGKDYLIIQPPKIFKKSEINTYNDHRMAMCFSLISLSGVPVTLIDPQCINKTFPKYFSKFFSICDYK